MPDILTFSCRSALNRDRDAPAPFLPAPCPFTTRNGGGGVKGSGRALTPSSPPPPRAQVSFTATSLPEKLRAASGKSEFKPENSPGFGLSYFSRVRLRFALNFGRSQPLRAPTSAREVITLSHGGRGKTRCFWCPMAKLSTQMENLSSIITLIIGKIFWGDARSLVMTRSLP